MGENDTLHYVWDLSRQPSVLVALCERDANVSINWNETDVKTVQFTIKPKYTMSFVLTKVSNDFFFRPFFQYMRDCVAHKSSHVFLYHNVIELVIQFIY